MNRPWWLLLLLLGSGMVQAEETVCPHKVFGKTNEGTEMTSPCVGFWLLREGICRTGWIQRDPDTGVDVVYEIKDSPCPQEELRGYLK